jgi:hypothetical protein
VQYWYRYNIGFFFSYSSTVTGSRRMRDRKRGHRIGMKTEICVEGWGAPASHQAGRLFSEALRDKLSFIFCLFAMQL